ncbi:MAG: adenosylmethionine--8-amino-7-oxononanoate transaminase [Rickettsiales bacterium]|nr:adenosylmethionine--8-amino-7-oxononanoate transaminase [Rickettsiales bacterium]
MKRNPHWQHDGLNHIWLPYNQMQISAPPLPVVDAEGSTLTLADGRTLIDGIASWWCMVHGYRHPYMIEQMTKQLQTLPHIMFGGISHEPAFTLAERLAKMTPKGLERVFFADSGSVSVEVAIKMALQYWRNKGKPQKGQFLCFKNGYHGDTLGAMSVSDSLSVYHQAFSHALQHQFTVQIPKDEYDFADFESLVADNAKHIAGCFIEPLVQGAGGMRFHSPDVLAEIHRICKRHDILLIADEIAVGFGRTGYMFACEEAGITPDIMCLGKSLTGGMMTMAATLATEEVFDAFLDDSYDKAFMHGPTYMANPLACSAAHASLDLFESEPRQTQIEAIEAQLITELAPCRSVDGVIDVRVKGALGVVQLDSSRPLDSNALRERFVELGVWIRPIGDVIYLTPPLVITQTELTQLTSAIVTVVQEWSKE